MPYDEALAQRVPETLRGKRGVTERKMFGGVAFMRRGHMFVGQQSLKGALPLDVIEDAVEPILESTIICPVCGATAEEEMPTDACVFFYECKGCHKRLRPLPGDCCVFCSYGSVKCPPVQLQKDCCA